MPFDLNNPAKFWGIVLYLVLASTGWFIGRMDTTQWAAATGPLIGYLIGNGVAARKGDPIEPALSRRTPSDPA